MYKTLLALLLLLAFHCHAQADKLYFPSFHEGLMRAGKSENAYAYYTKPKKSKSSLVKDEECFAKYYETALSALRSEKRSGEPTIPKIIHAIWLGSEIPEKYAAWQQTWKDIDGWEYYLWTDREVESLTLINRELYERAANYGEKSDILRLELLYQFGGLYVDTDFACINPAYFEAFHHSLDFYIGIEPIYGPKLKFGNALIGSCPGHPLLQELLSALPASCAKYESAHKNSTVGKTGPDFVTRVINDYIASTANRSHSLSIFPSSFFYPLNSSELFSRWKEGKFPVPGEKFFPETCGIHYWEGSWFKSL